MKSPLHLLTIFVFITLQNLICMDDKNQWHKFTSKINQLTEKTKLLLADSTLLNIFQNNQDSHSTTHCDEKYLEQQKNDINNLLTAINNFKNTVFTTTHQNMNDLTQSYYSLLYANKKIDGGCMNQYLAHDERYNDLVIAHKKAHDEYNEKNRILARLINEIKETITTTKDLK